MSRLIRLSRLFAGAGLLFLGAWAGIGNPPMAMSPWTQPVPVAWPAVNRWDDRFEQEYADFVGRLGQAIAQRRCGTLERCLRDPEANLLYDPLTDPLLDLGVDCAKLPYVLRGYFSFKRRLPFGFVCDIDGSGRDVRYMSGIRPTRWCTWRQFGSPRTALHSAAGLVHSGMFRMAPEVENGDFYPAAVHRRAIRPGTVFYDPNGHVLTVAAVEGDGSIFFIDGHPDGTLTWKRFGKSYVVGGRSQGGGFKNFRPVRLVDGEIVRAANCELPWFDDLSQWDRAAWRSGEQQLGYHDWVRAALADSGVQQDPVREFGEELRALCGDVADRADAVELAVAAGLPGRPHPAELPWNIYGSTGDWEAYSTPARDVRLRVAFRELRDTAAAAPDSGQRQAMRVAWQEFLAQPECLASYVNSAGGRVELTLSDVLARLFDLSFDPYHCPELRWGAPLGRAEAETCPRDRDKLEWYSKERLLRNRMERTYDVPTPIGEGPQEAPDVDVRRVLGLLPQAQAGDPPWEPGSRLARTTRLPR